MTMPEDPTRPEVDDLFDPSGVADEHRDAELVAIERSLAPLTADVPPLSKLPPRTSAPTLDERPTMTMPPAIPSSARPASSSRGIVFGAVALAAVATLALVWATRPPAAPQVAAEPDAKDHVAPVGGDREASMAADTESSGPALELRAPDATDVSRAELVVVPFGPGTTSILPQPGQRVSVGTFERLHGQAASTQGSYTAVQGGLRLAPAQQRFAVDLQAGQYVACGKTTSMFGHVAIGCTSLEVDVDGGQPSVRWIRMVDADADAAVDEVEPADAKRVSPDLKDPFESSGERQPGQKQRAKSRRKKKSVDSADLKDPFSASKSEDAASADLPDPFKGASKKKTESNQGEVLNPWSD